jgi:hypothetical protein
MSRKEREMDKHLDIRPIVITPEERAFLAYRETLINEWQKLIDGMLLSADIFQADPHPSYTQAMMMRRTH